MLNNKKSKAEINCVMINQVPKIIYEPIAYIIIQEPFAALIFILYSYTLIAKFVVQQEKKTVEKVTSSQKHRLRVIFFF